MKSFANNILADPIFVHKLQAEWARLRCVKAVDKSELNALIDDYASMLDEAQEMNFTRWDILNTLVHQNYVARGSFEAEINYLKSFLSVHLPWMDTKLNCKAGSYKLTITDAKWATLYIPYAAVIPDGLKVYVVTGTQGNLLVKEEVDVIEAHKPYLVNGEAGVYSLKGYYVPDWDAQTAGLLTGTNQTIDAPDDCYVMQKINGKVCFRKVVPGGNPTITPHKAYLNVPSFRVEAPERLFIDGEEDTNGLYGIESEGTQDGVLRVYGLNGAVMYEGQMGGMADEVLNTLPKGVYVLTVDGKEYKKIVRK
jgi:hypothetical protein